MRTSSLLVLMLAGLADTAHSAKKQPTEQHDDCCSVPTVTPAAGATAHPLSSTGVLPLMPPLRVNAARAGIGADPVEPSEKTAVTVRLLDIYTAHRTVLSQATAIAAKMFSSAGVRIEWRYQYSSRRQSRLDGDPVVRMRSHTPVTYLPTALASALPYQGSEITVFYDRVEQEIGPHFRAVLLAHVLVHEITHLLEGVSRHSASGIMKASWTADDKWTMIRKPMSFAPEDLALIRLGLASRAGTGRLLPGAKTAVPRPNHFGTSCVQCRY